jgi:hypothetical protein
MALAAAAVHGDRPVTRWSATKAIAGAINKAGRVGEFIGMWAIAKYKLGEVTTEQVAEMFGLNERTAYRRLDEFREVWGPPGLKTEMLTPDPVADVLIAEYRRRHQKLSASLLGRLAAEPVALPPGLLAAD